MLRVMALLLVLVMMLPMALACNKTDDPAKDPNVSGDSDPTGSDKPDDSGNDGDESDSEVQVGSAEIEMDMQGYTFEALARETEWFSNEVTAEDGTGDQILQAVYDRNWAVEEKYNCIMSQTFITEDHTVSWPIWRNSVSSGESIYKYSLNHMMQTAQESLNGTMLNLRVLPHINLEAEYWNQSMNKELTIGNKLYFTANEFCTSSVYFTWLMIFNMKMAEERDIDVYGMIDDGTWTIDNLYNIASQSYEDDGNATVDFGSDTFGLISYNTTVLTNYIFAFDIPVVHIDANNEVVMDFNDANTPMVTAVEKVYDLFYNSANGGRLMTDADLSANYSGLLHDNAICTKFSTNTAIFANTRLLGLETLRTADVQYGIIPFPKLTEEQDGYYSHVDGRGSLIFVPYTLPANEYEYVGLLLEVLAKKTKEDVMPVIQNAALIGRYSEDSDAYRCLEMTMNGRTYSFAYVFNSILKTSQPYWSIVNIIKSGSNSFTDFWKAKSRVSEREINSAMQKYAKANKD